MDLGDYLLRLASGDGYIVLDGEGKCRLKNRDGSEVVFDDGHGRKYSPDLPRPFFNFYRREGLIRQDRSARAECGLVFRLTKNGKERATCEGADATLASDAARNHWIWLYQPVRRGNQNRCTAVI